MYIINVRQKGRPIYILTSDLLSLLSSPPWGSSLLFWLAGEFFANVVDTKSVFSSVTHESKSC